jgi:hypothetical protein
MWMKPESKASCPPYLCLFCSGSPLSRARRPDGEKNLESTSQQ